VNRPGRTIAICILTGCNSSTSPGPTTPSNDAAPPFNGGSDAGTGSSGSCATSPVVWTDDGAVHCATSAEALLSSSTAQNPYDGGPVLETTLEVVVVQGSSPDIFSFVLTSAGAVSGTYGCAPDPQRAAEISYDVAGVYSTTPAGCAITVSVAPSDAGGMAATGTFSAMLTVSDGGMKTLSDGTFDLPVTSGTQ
jgi:hypothetical protein